MAEFGNRKSGIVAPAVVMAFAAALAAAQAEQRRLGPAFRPALRIEHVRPAAHFELCTNGYWYPHVIPPRFEQPADWFVWNSGGYGCKKRLDNADYLFHAWILGAGAEELAAWVGARWAAVGDMYYIQRLVEALYGCRGAE